MWPGPYGDRGSRKYLLASLDQSLQRMGLDYVDIFYSHRFDPDTPLEETMGALDTAVRQGKALYVGHLAPTRPRARARRRGSCATLGTPLLIHQPSYSMLNRWIEGELLDVLEREGLGCIVFSPLAQGLLTDRYLDGVPEGSRVRRGSHFSEDLLTEENLERCARSNEIAERRGQTLGADGARLGAARPARDLGADRREQRRAARAERGRARAARLRRRPSSRRSTGTPQEGGVNIWAQSSSA